MGVPLPTLPPLPPSPHRLVHWGFSLNRTPVEGIRERTGRA